jgi:hypothetical protein
MSPLTEDILERGPPAVAALITNNDDHDVPNLIANQEHISPSTNDHPAWDTCATEDSITNKRKTAPPPSDDNNTTTLENFLRITSCAIMSTPPLWTTSSHAKDPDDHMWCNYAAFEEPMSRTEALRQHDGHFWQEAMNEEILGCYNNGTWTEVDSKPWMNLISTKWVFKKKRGPDGEITRYRARLVVKGFGQWAGWDFGAIFAPVVRYSTIRMILALCAHYGLHKRHLDAPKAFTQAPIDADIYIKPPSGCRLVDGKVFKLLKSLYGLKQGAERWWKYLSAFLIEIGFTQCISDTCLFYLIISPTEFAIMTVYADDLLLCTTHIQLNQDIVAKLFNKFQVTDEGDFTWSLGMHITTSADRHTISIDMERYTIDILARFNFDNEPISPIPMDPLVRFSADNCPTSDEAKTLMQQYPYRPALGCLMFLMLVFRMDIAFPTISLSRFAHNPAKSMWLAMKKIYQYIKGTASIKLTYSRIIDSLNPLHSLHRCRLGSVIGYVTMMSGGAISWLSAFRQPGLSTCEVEYYGMSAVATEVVSHTHLLNELKPIQWVTNSENIQSQDVPPVTIHTDNNSALQVANNPIFHKRMKHTHIRHHVVRKFIKEHIIRYQHIYSASNCSDMMVKALPKAILRKHRAFTFGPSPAPAIVYNTEEQHRHNYPPVTNSH